MSSKLRAMLFGLGGVVALTSCASRPRINVVIMDDDDRYAEQIGDVRVVIGCKPGLAEEVALLFAHLRDLSRRGINLTDGSKVPYGWTTFSLQAVRGRLEVWEPNYEQETERLGRPEISASLTWTPPSVPFCPSCRWTRSKFNTTSTSSCPRRRGRRRR